MYNHTTQHPKLNNKWFIKQPINMAYMLALQTFVQSNGEISSALTKKHKEIFKHPWFIGWFKEMKEVTRPKMLNSDLLKRLLKKFLLDMSDMILIFGFAGFYYVKDMVKWIENNPNDYFTKLPFGIIPLRMSVNGFNSGTTDSYQPTLYGNYVYYTNTLTMEEFITFEYGDTKNISRIYEFDVFNNGAKFTSLSDGI